ncbi:MAG: hypothetical protein WBG86_11855 [Polyangiales bacterium]
MDTDTRVIDLAVACVTSVKNATQIELDMTQDTLPVLDHYAEMAKSPPDEVTSLLAPMCGAYFGELVRRELGDGQWADLDQDHEYWRLTFEANSLSFNPVGLALEVLMRGEAEGWGGHLEMAPSDRATVQRALSVYGEVPDEDFYRFAVRFEGIEQAYRGLLNNPGGMEPRP